jgi:hypothetical protein
MKPQTADGFARIPSFIEETTNVSSIHRRRMIETEKRIKSPLLDFTLTRYIPPLPG